MRPFLARCGFSLNASFVSLLVSLLVVLFLFVCLISLPLSECGGIRDDTA